MAKEYAENPEAFNLFAMDEYLDLMTRIIERLNPNIVVERFTSEVPPQFLIAPYWGKLRGDQILLKFEKLLEEKDTWQGKLFNA
jgi:hypothetical protein